MGTGLTIEYSTADVDRRFGGVRRLYGEKAFNRFRAAHVCVVGVGGVGSWAVEALARNGIGQLTLIDLDNVSESNVNRQLPALDPFFGRPKVEVLAERISAINPLCRVNLIEEFIDENNVSQLLEENFDFLIDAIDDLKAKTALVNWCIKQEQPFIVSGGAGGRMDPSRISLGDLGMISGDALLARLRYNLRRSHGFSRIKNVRFHVPCVFSNEPVQKPLNLCAVPLHGLSCAGYGASMVVTASFGLYAVTEVLKHLYKK